MLKKIFVILLISNWLIASEIESDFFNIILNAPAKEKENHLYTGKISVKKKKIKVLLPQCKSFAERERGADLLGAFFYSRITRHVATVREKEGIAISPHGAFTMRHTSIEDYKKYCYLNLDRLKDLYNFLCLNTDKQVVHIPYTESDLDWENTQPKNSLGIQLFAYFKGINTAVCVDPVTQNIENFEQIDVTKKLTRNDFKKVKDALVAFYNHGGENVVPTPLNIENLKVIHDILTIEHD
ncbi:MAG: hypothetical protein ACOYT8_03815 [Candidatus Dependentiae bacterium]